MDRRNNDEDEITVMEASINKQAEKARSSKVDEDSAFKMINSDALKDEYSGRYWALYRMIQKNDWQGVEDFVKQTKEAQSSKDALYRRLCKMIDMNDWQGAKDLVEQKKEAQSSEDAQGNVEEAQSSEDLQGKDEYYARYWPLYSMIEKNDWRGVEDFVNNHPDALTAKIVEPGSMTIFHMIVELLVDVESDEAACLLDKLASTVDPETLAQQSTNYGYTAVTLCAAKGNLKALKVLVKYNPDLTNMRDNDGSLPVHHAAYYGHKDTIHYLLEVTHGADIYSGNDGANVLLFLIAANLYGQYYLLKDFKHTYDLRINQF